MVDNDSKDRDKLRDLCRTASNCDFVEVRFNSGVAHALRRVLAMQTDMHQTGYYFLMTIRYLWITLWIEHLG